MLGVVPAKTPRPQQGLRKLVLSSQEVFERAWSGRRLLRKTGWVHGKHRGWGFVWEITELRVD